MTVEQTGSQIPAAGQTSAGNLSEAAGLTAPPATGAGLTPGAEGEQQTQAAAPEPVSREEYDKVKNELDGLKPWAERLVDPVRSNYDSPEAYEAAQLDQKRADASQTYWQGKAAEVERAIQARIDNGEITFDQGQRELRLEQGQIQLHQQQELQAVQLFDTRLKELVAKPEYADADPDYVRAIAEATGRPIEQICAESHRKINALKTRIIAAYNETKGKDEQETQQTPENGAGGASPVRGMPNPNTHPDEFDAWVKGQVAETNRLTGRA